MPTWMPKREYTVYDPATYTATGNPLTVILADSMAFVGDSRLIVFKDNNHRTIEVHHLAPGYSMMCADRDGNECEL